MSARDYPIVVRGPVEDLSDLLRIARHQGKIVLKTEKVKIKPVVFPYGNDYLVLVEPDGLGCSNALAVGGGKDKKVK